MITQADPATNPNDSHSLSVEQTRQLTAGLNPVPSAQKPALPVVRKQEAVKLGKLQSESTAFTARQKFFSGVHEATSCATQAELSGRPPLGATPPQMPEQQWLLSPRQGCPTSRQPNSLTGSGGGTNCFLRFFPFFLP